MTIPPLNAILWDKKIRTETKTKIFKTIVGIIITYGLEVWTTNKQTRTKSVSYTHLDVYKRQE